MSHSVRDHLGIEVSAYDRTIRRFIPGYEELLAVAARETVRHRPSLVLDLGAGTGALSEAVLLASRTARVELIDVDGEMLLQARSRLQAFRSRVLVREQSFFDPLPECDGIVAALALHHVRSLRRKRELYSKIHEALKPGGVFVNADAAVSSNPEQRKVTLGAWVRHMASRGIEEHDAYLHLESWAEEDTYFPLEDELSAVADAGFKAKCAWRNGPMSVVVGSKAR